MFKAKNIFCQLLTRGFLVYKLLQYYIAFLTISKKKIANFVK